MQIGDIFGRLTVVGEYSRDSYNRVIWECSCVCGGKAYARTDILKSGASKSCGCINKDRLSKHNQTNTPTYFSWASMKSRCNNPNDSSYYLYGGRGIKVCDRWLENDLGFVNFLEDMGERPSNKTLDRIDVDGNYSPENCRWSTASEQSQNTRIFRNNTSGHKGVSFCKSANKWQARIMYEGVRYNLGFFSLKEDAVVARNNAELKFKSTNGGK